VPSRRLDERPIREPLSERDDRNVRVRLDREARVPFERDVPRDGDRASDRRRFVVLAARADFVSPARARCLFTMRAATSSSRPL
jgi:hypothetical protein